MVILLFWHVFLSAKSLYPLWKWNTNFIPDVKNWFLLIHYTWKSIIHYPLISFYFIQKVFFWYLLPFVRCLVNFALWILQEWACFTVISEKNMIGMFIQFEMYVLLLLIKRNFFKITPIHCITFFMSSIVKGKISAISILF